MKAQLNARGAKTIRGLGRVFRNFDSFDGNHKVDAQEFFSGLREIQIDVTEAEAKVSYEFSIQSVIVSEPRHNKEMRLNCCFLGSDDDS